MRLLGENTNGFRFQEKIYCTVGSYKSNQLEMEIFLKVNSKLTNKNRGVVARKLGVEEEYLFQMFRP